MIKMFFLSFVCFFAITFAQTEKYLVIYEGSSKTYKKLSTIDSLKFIDSTTNTTPPPPIAGNWQILGNGFTTFRIENSLFVYNGTPYTIGLTSPSYNISINKYNGNSWELVTNNPSSWTMRPSLFIYNNVYYVAYFKSPNIIVEKYNGSSWEQVGTTVGFSKSGLSIQKQISFTVYGGIPYVAFPDTLNGCKATVKKYDGSNWIPVGTAGFSSDTADFITLFIDNNNLYIAYKDYGNGKKATVMKYNGSIWVPIGTAGFTAGRVEWLNFYVYNGTPFIAYKDYNNEYRAVVMKYDGSYWTQIGSSSVNPISEPHLFVYNGTPYVGYSENGIPKVMKYNGSSWVQVGNIDITTENNTIKPNLSHFYLYNGALYTFFQANGSGHPYTYYGTSMYGMVLTYKE